MEEILEVSHLKKTFTLSKITGSKITLVKIFKKP